MKKLLILLIVMMMLSAFGAAEADDLADVKEAGELVFGVSPDYIPFVFYDDSGKLTGISVGGENFSETAAGWGSVSARSILPLTAAWMP